MTSLSDRVGRTTAEPTTVVPSELDMDAILPELSSPQERYDHGFQRGYMAGYAAGARQAEAESAADLAAQKSAWSSSIARASNILGQLASSGEQYLAACGPRDIALTEQLLEAAFGVAAAVVGSELRARPELAAEKAIAALRELPVGPAVVRVNPIDEAMMSEAASTLAEPHRTVHVVADPAIGPGGCVVAAGAKTADARVEAALARVKEAFCATSPDGSAGTPLGAQIHDHPDAQLQGSAQ